MVLKSRTQQKVHSCSVFIIYWEIWLNLQFKHVCGLKKKSLTSKVMHHMHDYRGESFCHKMSVD